MANLLVPLRLVTPFFLEEMSKKIIIEFTEEAAEEVIKLIRDLLDNDQDPELSSEEDPKKDV